MTMRGQSELLAHPQHGSPRENQADELDSTVERLRCRPVGLQSRQG